MRCTPGQSEFRDQYLESPIMNQPAWLAAAWAEFGVREVAGTADHPAILGYYAEAGHPAIQHDEIAWCAAFAGAMLKRAHVAGTGSLLARSYLAWGAPVETPRLGAIVVLERGADPGAGHVGFFVGGAGKRIFLLGGNQGDAVTVAAFETSRVLGYRWPGAQLDQAPEDGGLFDRALKHVLEMEGGFTDDPHDPGGPTNKGITLEVFARWKAVTVEATSRARLVDDLKRIPDDVVRSIYEARYWRPGRCAELPGPIALFHFDACVNHGVGGAARLLQAALGVSVDGEIGPVTLAAVKQHSITKTLEGYAEVRRARYRALPHFWRFGRGWLNRVETTLAAARAEMGKAAILEIETTKGTDDMMQDPTKTVQMPGDGKWWVESKTIWGALITAAAAVVPVLGPLIGIELSGEVVRQAGEQTISAVQAIAGLFGTLLTIYGRISAVQRLARRVVNVKL